ncbi:MAG: hypothetical protein SPL99_07535 [Catonella sp.]|nr:hypothetical protein [Catonella sp.]MDY6356429.1 hypothetical protein [Catonella sp.]
MLVSFYSGTGSRSGVTTSAACVSAMYSARFKGRCAIIENHAPKYNGLSDAFIERDPFMVAEAPSHYGRRGTNFYYDWVDADMPPMRRIESAVKICDGKLHYIPQEKESRLNPDVFDFRFDKVAEKILDDLETRYDIVFTDLKSTDCLSTSRIVERSDLIILNLPQERRLINDFLYYYHPSYGKKSWYLINNYCEGRYGTEEMIRDNKLDSHSIHRLPSTDILPIISTNGNLAKFLTNHRYDTSTSLHFNLIHNLKTITTNLNRFAGGNGLEDHFTLKHY